MGFLKDKSLQNWEIAAISVSMGYYNVAVSRFYYSLFEAAKGFLISAEIWNASHENTHENVIAAIYECLKKQGIQTNSETSSTLNMYNLLRKQREIADYKDELYIDEYGFNKVSKEYIKTLVNFLRAYEFITLEDWTQMEKQYDCYRA